MNEKPQPFIIKTNGRIEITAPKNGSDFSLAELKAAIGGGYIETIPLAHNRIMVCDEDGKRKRLPANPTASRIYGSDWIVGDVLVCDRSQIK
jgi:hypothetical protein